MVEPKFLSVVGILRMHHELIETYGGSHGVRDQRLLESAIAQPESAFGGNYLHGGLFEMAAAYLYHLVQNHPFHDGNKRIGAAAAFIFLDFNGINLEATEEDFEKLVLSVASGSLAKAQVTEFLRANSKVVQIIE